MRWAPRRSLAAMALAGLLSAPPGVYATGLGQIQLLSGKGEQFAALIPFVDGAPGDAVSVALADRNRYPLLSAYSASATALSFSLQRGLDGTPTGILVTGPAKFSESELHFAVSMNWASGGAVREYQVDYRHPGSHRKVPRAPRDDDKKTSLAPTVASGLGNLGLGVLKVSSLPGQPLVAQMDVFGTGLSLEQLQVRIVPEAVGGAGGEQLASIHHVLVRLPSGGFQVQLSSGMPLTASQLAFRLEVSQGGLQMARRYQLSARDGAFQVAEQTLSGRRAEFKVLRVLPGDSLSAIASRLSHDHVSRRDVIERLYQENPQAFISGDINKLLAGALLKYPDTWSVHSPSAGEPQIPPPAARSLEEPLAARQLKAAALQNSLREQEQRLAQAQQLSHSLESRLSTLRAEQKAAKAAAASKPAPASAAAARAPVHTPSAAVLEGSAALVAAAAATALALRRRHLRRQAAGQVNEEVVVPTVEGMRQWLRYDPTRNDLRFRLLQLLASTDDRQAFLVEAAQARQYFEPHGPMWEGVVQMGRELAPDHDWSDWMTEDATPAIATASTAQAVTAAVAAEVVPAAALPERPILQELELELDGLQPDTVVFREPAQAPVEPPAELDKSELAKLYLEMGDTEAARSLMH